MSELVADCPRCGADQMTFDLRDQVIVGKKYDWQNWLEVFCVCRHCDKPTIFVVSQNEPNHEAFILQGLSSLNVATNRVVTVERYVGIQDNTAEEPPEYLPSNIESVFREGAACMAIGCYNAAATMFRLCLDLSTRSLMPADAAGEPSQKIRRSLGLRLGWLFDNDYLPEALRELSSCIKDDGNDGAHEGILGKEDAADILDFTYILLERLFTEPKRLDLAAKRRAERRKKPSE